MASSPEMLASTCSGVSSGMEGRIASWASCAAVAERDFQTRFFSQTYGSPQLLLIKFLAAAAASSAMRRLSVRI